MKNRIITNLVFGLLLATVPVFAAEAVAPIVSIGIGNGNDPVNTAPTHESVVSGDFDVYATVEDGNLENYHFRVVKEGASEGHTCTESGALFAPENQGYASTTLSKDACGFNYNQSVYTDISFTNQIITSLNTIDLSSFGGFGNYFLILGAKDASGNRSADNYLEDPRVKITINSATTNATSTETTETSTSTEEVVNSGNGNGGGGSSSGGGGSLGGRRHDISGILGTTGGEVLGVSTAPALECADYLKTYIKYGADNDMEDVKRLQVFLNQFFEVNNPVTGFYGPITLDMVNKFQEHQSVAVLLPWEIAGLPTYGPTGYVYKTTQRWVNILKCPLLVTTSPIPTLP